MPLGFSLFSFKEIPLDWELPHVAFPDAGDENPYWGWVELYNYYSQYSCVFLSEEVLDLNANDFLTIMLSLVIEEYDEDLFFFINSAGRSIHAGIALYDMLQMVPGRVFTISLGIAVSTGSYILSGGAVRMAVSSAKIRLSLHPKPMPPKMTAKCTRKRKCIRQLRQKGGIVKALRDRIIQDYVERTGRSESIIEMDLERYAYMTAMEAKDYRLIDYMVYNLWGFVFAVR